MKNLLSRIYSLMIKLLSLKTIPAIIFTVGYFKDMTTSNMIACFVSWALVVGVRYAEKINGLIKNP